MASEVQQRQSYEEGVVQASLQEFAERQTYRANFGIQWEEVAELVEPNARNTFFFGNYNFPGMKKTQQQVDATAMAALSRFAAILDSLLTPRNQTWHALVSNDEDVMKDRQSRLWFERVTKLLFKYRYSPLANFTGQNQQVFRSLGAFGTGGLFIDRYAGVDGSIGLRYKAIPIGELYLGENHQGQVDGFIRHFRLTARQAYQVPGWKDRLDAAPGLIDAMERNSESPFDFIHRVCPRTDYEPGRLDARGKLFASYYISLQGRALLSEGGYNSLPIAITRYDQAPGEMYGRSPAMNVLPAIKTLNAEKRDYLTQGHRAVNPILLTADDGIVDFSMRPGAINKGGIDDQGRLRVQTLPIGNIAVSKEMMDEERQLINDAMLVSLFQILTETPQMTATEVMERINEKGILLAPTVGRQQSEYLGPMIHRELDLLAQMRLLPPMPAKLARAYGNYDVQYTSPLAQMQRAQEVVGFMRTAEQIKEFVAITQDPSLLDPLDFDVATPEIARIQGVTESWLCDDDKIAQKREARAAAQKRQEQIQAAPAAAAMMKAQAASQQAGVAPQQPQGVPAQ